MKVRIQTKIKDDDFTELIQTASRSLEEVADTDLKNALQAVVSRASSLKDSN